MKSGYAFIVSNLDIEGALPVQVLDGHVFRSARDQEIKQIQSIFAKSLPKDNPSWVRYDALVREERYEKHSSIHIEELPREKWRYWVVAFEGDNNHINDIELAGLLLPHPVEFGFQVGYSEPDQLGEPISWHSMPLHVIERYSSYSRVWQNPESLTVAQLSSISTIVSKYRSIPDNLTFVKTALQNFSDLRRVPEMSDLIVVGLFSIIESLVTHAPRLTETLDSINHQITNKMILLRKRVSSPVEHNRFFLHAAEEAIWKKLYAYRSSVAHGTPIAFHGELQVLKDRESVIRFLRENIKQLLLLGLHEPEFLADLRKC